MIKKVLFFLLLAVPAQGIAQVELTAEGFYGIGHGKDKADCYGGLLLVGKRFDDISVSVGTGYEVLHKDSNYDFIPILASVRYYPFESRIAPFVSMTGGGCIGITTKNEDTGEKYRPDVLFAPGIGLDIPVFGRHCVTLQVRYNVQHFKYDATVGSGNYSQHVSDAHSFKQVAFSVGFTF